jgi:two-component system, chemotaxis family, chemotaxis protein CheY
MSSMKNKRVLIVDDNDHYIRFVREHLLLHNYEIAGEAKNCEQAITLFQSEKPDLILLDFEMLNTSGIHILQEILSLDSDAMVIMLSGRGDVATMQLCLDSGAYHFIRKDYPLETIFSVIDDSLKTYA